MEIPKINFSKWYSWSERKTIPNRNLSGVYILAKFNKKPKNEVNLLDKKIIYFGETTRSFLIRWREFNYSAFQSKSGNHSGGCTYHKEINDRGEDLFVAIFPIELENNDLKNSYRYFIERKLIFEFIEYYNRLPILNTK